MGCQIKKIHFEMHPPSVTVIMMDTESEVGTEFDKLRPIKSWFCRMCPAENHDPSATKCYFCGMGRNYKEKISVLDDNDGVDHAAQHESKSNESASTHREQQEEEDMDAEYEQSECPEIAPDAESEQEAEDD